MSSSPQDLYPAIIARHYAAYRPSLHEQILRSALGSKSKFNMGLDIGCGTGQSAIALTEFCTKVEGLEPSQEMLAQALPHPKVHYSAFDGKYIPFEADMFDLVVFAGSFFYAKSQRMVDEVSRICRPGAIISLYDFDINLNEIYNKMEIMLDIESDYDHEANFEGLLTREIQLLNSFKDKGTLVISADKLSHLILSTVDTLAFFRDYFDREDPYISVQERIEMSMGKEELAIPFLSFTSTYRYGDMTIVE